jgi:hypothetical protein
MGPVHCTYGLRGVRAQLTTEKGGYHRKQVGLAKSSNQLTVSNDPSRENPGLHSIPVGRFAKAEYPGGRKVIVMLPNVANWWKSKRARGGTSGRRRVPSTEYGNGGTMASLNWLLSLLVRWLVGWQ